MALTASPRRPPLLGRVPETPAPAGGQGIVVTRGRAPGGPEIWIHGCLTLEEVRATKRSPEIWVRALTAVAISQRDQNPYVSNLIGDRLIAADDIEIVGNGPSALALVAFSFPLLERLGLAPREEIYYVQVSSREIRSNVLVVDVGG